MQTFICLLRGINVSGQNKIKMIALKASFEKLGFTNVVTYIQSGNVVFNSIEKDSKKLETIIHQMLKNDFAFDVTVIVLTPDHIKYAVTNNPYVQDTSKDPKKFYVVFLQEKPQQQSIDVLATYDYSPEEYRIDNRLIYYYAANGAGNAKMSNNFFESKLKVRASTRNWRTINKLMELSS